MQFTIPVFFFIVLLSGYSQAEVDQFEDKQYHLSVGFELQEYSLLVDNDVSGRELKYTPNLNGIIVPRISNRFATLSWAFEVPLSEEETSLRGQTDYSDIRLGFELSSFRFNVHYLQYRGFYVENSQAIDPNFGLTNPEIIFPDLYMRSLGGEITWIKNKKTFSIKALDSQTERVNSSGGSLLAGLSFAQARFSNPSTIIPAIIQSDFSTDANLSGGEFNTLSTKVGYGYIAANKWFIGGALQAGPGVTFATLSRTNNQNDKSTILSMRVEALLSGGYNGDVFFFSLKSDVKQDYFYLNNSDTSIGTQLLSGGLNFGIHLEAL